MNKEKRIEDKSKLLNIESKKVQFKKHERLKNIQFPYLWTIAGTTIKKLKLVLVKT